MLYIFSLLYIIIKGFAFVVHREILFYLTPKNIIFVLIVLLAITICKKRIKYKRLFPNIVDHFIQYRFKNKREFYYSTLILSSSIMSYITVISYLRLRAFNNPIDLKIIYSSMHNLYLKLPFGIFCYNIFVLLILMYLFILLIKLLKKRLNIHLTKMHFYLISFKHYIKIHNNFRDYISINGYIIERIFNTCYKCEAYIFCYYLFGYYKNKCFCDYDEEHIPIKLRQKQNIWTKEESKSYNDFEEKYSIMIYLEKLKTPMKFFFYHLHVITLVTVVIHDILFNNYVLKHVAWILPFVFFYQMYVFISSFVEDKVTYDVSAEINILYYQNVTYINEKLMVFEGELFQRPDYQKIMIQFLEYEAADFYNTRIKR